jgi:hypothetical protein
LTTALRTDKYVISCAARSGSTMLVQLLRSHPDVLSHGEVFAADSIGMLDGRYAALRRDDPSLSQRLFDYRRGQPEPFVYDVVYDSQGRKAVGFKFKTDEAFSPAWADIRAIVARDIDIKVIFLRRRDMLAQYVSHEAVLRHNVPTLVVHPAARERLRIKPFKISIPALLEYVDDVARRERLAAETYADHPSMHVDYEDLVLEEHSVRRTLTDFLEIPPFTLSTPSQRIIADHASLVVNRDEVLAALAARERPSVPARDQ